MSLEALADQIQQEHRARMTERGRKRRTFRVEQDDKQVMTWQGSIYLERCVEHPDYRIKTTYSPQGQYCLVYHKQKIIGRAANIEDARAKALAHLEGK